MRIGTRIIKPQDVKRWDAEIYQVSIYRGWLDDIRVVKKCVSACRDKGVPSVMHPVGFPLLEPESFWLTGAHAEHYRSAVTELASILPLSFENAVDTHDALWFWEQFRGSITLDIGHLEAAGMNAVEYVQDLQQDLIERIEYIHLHHNGLFRNGLTDHHPLHIGCRELTALAAFLNRKHDVAVILEINETDMIDDSLSLLRDLRDRLNL
jgi:sugar phosphate isomerase/epimerase